MANNENREQIVLIPPGMLKLIPLFGGDKRQLNLFIRQCEYVINKYAGSMAQNIYVMHLIMSRLTDNAAALISEREDVSTWDEFKQLLTIHFGDPRSEECIAIELESLKIRQGESYLDFCSRIQSVRSVLISKVNLLSDANLKQSKIIIYNNTSLNVFLYNLPENMVRVVRLKSPNSLEEALSVVMEEVNFHDQYTARNKMLINKPHIATQPPVIPSTFKFGNSTQPPRLNSFNPASQLLAPKFKFGIPQTQGQSQALMHRPQQFTGYRPPQPTGFRPQIGYRPPFTSQPQWGIRPQQFGMRPQQFGVRPQNPGYTQFGYKPNQPTHNQGNISTDVSMRTAPPPKMQQGFNVNELEFYDNQSYDLCYENYEQNADNENEYFNHFAESDIQQLEPQVSFPDTQDIEGNNESTASATSEEAQNFHMRLITNIQK